MNFAMLTCNPLSAWPELGAQLRVLSWELQPPCDESCLAAGRRDWWIPENIVVPYHCTGVHPKTNFSAHRRTFVLDTALPRFSGRRHCTHCSVCNVSFSSGYCPVDCFGIRIILGQQVVKVQMQVQKHIALGNVHKFHDLKAAWGLENVTDLIDSKRLASGDSQGQKEDSVFCLEPFGDTLTRRSFYEDILLGCIPVVFRNDSTYLAHMAFSDRIPYRRMWVHIPMSKVLMGLNVIDFLSKVPSTFIRKKQALLSYWAPALMFADPSLAFRNHSLEEIAWPAPESVVSPNAFLLSIEATYAVATGKQLLTRQKSFSPFDHELQRDQKKHDGSFSNRSKTAHVTRHHIALFTRAHKGRKEASKYLKGGNIKKKSLA